MSKGTTTGAVTPRKPNPFIPSPTNISPGGLPTVTNPATPTQVTGLPPAAGPQPGQSAIARSLLGR